MRLITVLLTTLGVCYAHGVMGGTHEVETVPEEVQFSMPNLISIYENEDDISVNWQGDGQLNEGRYILTRDGFPRGQIWNKNFFNNDEFTFELTLRSLGFHGVNSGSGLAVYLIENPMELERFKGLKIMFLNDGQPSVKVYLNDGSKNLSIGEFIGSYLVEYQDTNVPVTLKFGYSASSGVMKMTIDNKLMFETKEIKFPVKDMRFGIVGESDIERKEQFEILKLKAYRGFTDDLKVKCKETLYSNYEIGGPPPSSNGNEFNERQRKLRDSLNSDNGGLVEVKNTLAKIEGIFATQSNKNQLDIELLKGDINELNYKIESMVNLFKRQFEMMDSYDLRMGSIDKILQSQLDKSDTINDRVNKLVKNKDSDNQSRLKPIEKVVSPGHSIVWVLIFIVVLLVLLSMLIFKLRNDIKHFKVL